MDTYNWITLLILVLVVGGAAGIITSRISARQHKDKSSEERLRWYESTFLHRTGIWLRDDRYVDFNILSTDGGETWHSVREQNGGFMITGEADPQLIEQLRAKDKLDEFMK